MLKLLQKITFDGLLVMGTSKRLHLFNVYYGSFDRYFCSLIRYTMIIYFIDFLTKSIGQAITTEDIKIIR